MMKTIKSLMLTVALVLSGFFCMATGCDEYSEDSEGPQSSPNGKTDTVPGACESMEAEGVGDCMAFLGVVWDGSSCHVIGGCSCEGEDCGSLYRTVDECEAAHGQCGQGFDCDAMDVQGVGPCMALLGVSWDGTQCHTVGGCSCEGADCDKLYPTIEECETAHVGCPPPTQTCDPMDVREVGYCEILRGYAWNGSTCQSVGGCSCEGPDCDNLFQTKEACEAAYASCGQPESKCGAMAAQGEGPCMALLGFTWDGTQCATLGGCSCNGDDCGSLYPTLDACEDAYASCLNPTCQAMDARGEGPCMALLGFAWDGTQCATLGGCSCNGDDCGNLYPTLDACELAHQECL